MYIATLSNRIPYDGKVDYRCYLVDDEGLMPERMDNVTVDADRDTERFLRAVKNQRCSYWEEEYLRSLSVEELSALPSE